MRLVLLTATLGVVACEGPTAPAYAVEIALTDSVEARRSANEVNVVISVRLKNFDARVLYYEAGCGHALQRREGSTWRLIAIRCGGPPPNSIALDKGESHLFTFRWNEPLPSQDWPAVGAAGEYRVVLWLSSVPRNSYGFPPNPLALSSRVTPVFSIKEVVVVL
jgi:hypothetical protein